MVPFQPIIEEGEKPFAMLMRRAKKLTVRKVWSFSALRQSAPSARANHGKTLVLLTKPPRNLIVPPEWRLLHHHITLLCPGI
jgi:hypothetical protein